MIKILFSIFILILIIRFIKKNILKSGYIDNRLNSNNYWMLSYDFKNNPEKNKEIVLIKSKHLSTAKFPCPPLWGKAVAMIL